MSIIEDALVWLTVALIGLSVATILGFAAFGVGVFLGWF